MIVSATALGILIIAATVLVAIAPIVLIVLWLRDNSKGLLW